MVALVVEPGLQETNKSDVSGVKCEIGMEW